MLILICFFGILLLFAGFRLYLYGKQMREWTRQLQELSPQSNQRLTCFVRDKATKALCLEMNNYIDAQQKAVLKSQEAERELKYTIACVSHDIRTPLALIVGYTDRLAKSSNLTEEEKRITDTICRRSQLISQLVSDLNLTSKLAYDAQPLHLEKCSPALLLRECTADLYNEELESENGPTEVELDISPEMEKAVVFADGNLVKRALRNLIGNSVRHNPQGCQIRIRLYEKDGMACFCITDSGTGIPQVVVENMDTQTEKIHIMGLRLARQIARAHGGNMEFLRRETGTYDVGIRFPAE